MTAEAVPALPQMNAAPRAAADVHRMTVLVGTLFLLSSFVAVIGFEIHSLRAATTRSATLRNSVADTFGGSNFVSPRLRATENSSVTARLWTMTVSIAGRTRMNWPKFPFAKNEPAHSGRGAIFRDPPKIAVAERTLVGHVARFDAELRAFGDPRRRDDLLPVPLALIGHEDTKACHIPPRQEEMIGQIA